MYYLTEFTAVINNKLDEVELIKLEFYVGSSRNEGTSIQIWNISLLCSIENVVARCHNWLRLNNHKNNKKSIFLFHYSKLSCKNIHCFILEMLLNVAKLKFTV